jgi:glutaminyl-peptide cyclotransferase
MHHNQSKSFSFNSPLVLIVLLFSTLGFTACPKNDNRSAGPAPSPIASNAITPFDAERAMEHLRKQVGFGQRIAGSAELVKTRDYIVNELKSYGLKVSLDEFNASTPIGQIHMANIVAELPGESSDVVILSSHYETKILKERVFLGANDPGSSVATVLEIARVLAASKEKPKLTCRFLFFDGEESICEDWEECGKPGAPDNTYGSRHYAEQIRNQNELVRVRALILLDLMGYKNLQLGRDTMSTRWLQDLVWQTGREIGYGDYFVDRPEGVGGDDHEPFLRAGIDSLDIIQLSGYPYWHRPEDTIDKVSGQSMKIVGDTIIVSMPKIAKRFGR